jgi:hypothetical protein
VIGSHREEGVIVVRIKHRLPRSYRMRRYPIKAILLLAVTSSFLINRFQISSRARKRVTCSPVSAQS